MTDFYDDMYEDNYDYESQDYDPDSHEWDYLDEADEYDYFDEEEINPHDTYDDYDYDDGAI